MSSAPAAAVERDAAEGAAAAHVPGMDERLATLKAERQSLKRQLKEASREVKAQAASNDQKAPGHPTKTPVEDVVLAIPLWFGTATSGMVSRLLPWMLSCIGSKSYMAARLTLAFLPSFVNKWAQRWRARWGVRRKILRQGVHRDPSLLRKKVLAFWRTIHYLNQKYSEKDLLYVNLDETGVGYNMPGPAGCVVASPPSRRYLQARVLKQHVRGSMTYISIICDPAEIQGKLPHYLIGTRTKLTKRLLWAQRA
eukprot:s967_g9.t1